MADHFLPLAREMSAPSSPRPSLSMMPRKLQLSMPTMQAILPGKIRRKLRSPRLRNSRSQNIPPRSISQLTCSINPADTLRSLRRHQWGYTDMQYIFLVLVFIFSLCIIQSPGPVAKTCVVGGLALLLIIPVTSQFFLPFLPIATWLVLFFSCQFITGEHRPGVWVRVLPALENIFYGANLSNILSAHRNTVLDVLAWIPYGLTHFGAPFVCSALMFVFAPPGTTPQFARAFGYMNITGVLIQLLFPCSPPWYENMYGLAPANYSMPGSPAGLAAIDKLLGIDLYTSTFTASPMVFGAFPSLHSASATMEALFMSRTFPKLRPLFVIYTLWLWWATMYLSHHYAVDLVAGSCIAAIAYLISKANWLPRMQSGKMFRWQYEYVELGEENASMDSAYSTVLDEESYPICQRDSDEWTIGSTSSYNGSPRKSFADSRFPSSTADDWEGETLASGVQSDEEHHKA